MWQMWAIEGTTTKRFRGFLWCSKVKPINQVPIESPIAGSVVCRCCCSILCRNAPNAPKPFPIYISFTYLRWWRYGISLVVLFLSCHVPKDVIILIGAGQMKVPLGIATADVFHSQLLPGCPLGVPVWPPNIPSDQTLPCGSTWHCFLAFSIQIEFTTSLSSATSGKIKKTRRDAKKAMQLPTWRSWHWHVQMLGGGFTFGELSSFNVLAVLAEPDGLTVVNGDNGAQFASPVRRFGPSPRLCDNVCMSVSCVANGHPYWAFNAILE